MAVYTDAARDNLRSRLERADWEATALGVSRAHIGFSALPAVRGELESIIRVGDGRENDGILPGVIRMDQDFTKISLADSLNRGTPVVHIASHFKLEPGNIGDSFLLLGDGRRLTLERVHAGAFQFGKVDQLTLSACNTAMHVDENAGREMEGLGVVAQKQGARAVLATLWAINDESTGVFMPRFYTLLQREDMTRTEALRQAQVEFIRGILPSPDSVISLAERGRRVSDQGAGEEQTFSGYSHPFFWAPFILMGNWL
ncbi:MAG: CHAT domain-containing protein [Synergistaceae bacterium]|nr:CHAT domain-containing protein [Synergistaceae bacterium]